MTSNEFYAKLEQLKKDEIEMKERAKKADERNRKREVPRDYSIPRTANVIILKDGTIKTQST